MSIINPMAVLPYCYNQPDEVQKANTNGINQNVNIAEEMSGRSLAASVIDFAEKFSIPFVAEDAVQKDLTEVLKKHHIRTALSGTLTYHVGKDLFKDYEQTIYNFIDKNKIEFPVAKNFFDRLGPKLKEVIMENKNTGAVPYSYIARDNFGLRISFDTAKSSRKSLIITPDAEKLKEGKSSEAVDDFIKKVQSAYEIAKTTKSIISKAENGLCLDGSCISPQSCYGIAVDNLHKSAEKLGLRVED